MTRKQINSALHVVSIKMCGDDTALRGMLSKYGVQSTLQLTDEQAAKCLLELEDIYRKTLSTNKKVSEIIDPDSKQMTRRQRAMLIKLTRYKYNWKKEATFAYILETCPDLRNMLTNFEIKKSKLHVLFSLMSKRDADMVLKRLTAIERRNEKRSISNEA